MYESILKFWFEELSPAQWWAKDEQLDQLIQQKFSTLHAQAARCELFDWRKTARGRLAEVLILDQFSRNIYRGSHLSFACDSLALALAQEAIASNADKDLQPVERSFLYLPFMHSESLKIHEVAVQLFTQNGIQNNLDFEYKHQQIIQHFGRYPHRNNLLGRISTSEEIEFLTQPNSSF